MFIPYNTNRTWLSDSATVVGSKHMNPDTLRWELHRVWEVEATLVSGKRHAIPKRRFYLDEDTYIATLGDSWDAQGQLWHTSYNMPMVMPDLPGTTFQGYVVHNLLNNSYVYDNHPYGKKYQFRQVKPWPASFFTPESLAAQGTR